MSNLKCFKIKKIFNFYSLFLISLELIKMDKLLEDDPQLARFVEGKF